LLPPSSNGAPVHISCTWGPLHTGAASQYNGQLATCCYQPTFFLSKTNRSLHSLSEGLPMKSFNILLSYMCKFFFCSVSEKNKLFFLNNFNIIFVLLLFLRLLNQGGYDKLDTQPRENSKSQAKPVQRTWLWLTANIKIDLKEVSFGNANWTDSGLNLVTSIWISDTEGSENACVIILRMTVYCLQLTGISQYLNRKLSLGTCFFIVLQNLTILKQLLHNI
jgi:hypothetical protein